MIPKKINSDKTALNSVDDIIEYFRTNLVHIYYISHTKINLQNIHKRVNRFHYISLDDDSCNRLEHLNNLNLHQPGCLFANIVLANKELVKQFKSDQPSPNFVFLNYDFNTEKLLNKHQFKLLNPPFALYQELDSKIDIINIVQKLGIPTIPCIISEIKDNKDIESFIEKLGTKIVIQSPFGSAGEGTYFIRNEKDYLKYRDELTHKGPMKIMREINCKQYGIDACSTRCGTILGPILTDLVGNKYLTNFEGGSCGNEIYDNVIDVNNKIKILEYTKKIGNYLYTTKRFRGSFTVDYLLDRSNNQIYFGEINPRISSAGFLTNEILDHCSIPLFLFHLLEFLDVEFKIDVDEFNLNTQKYIKNRCFSQLIISNTSTQTLNTKNIKNGIWRMNDHSITFLRNADSIHDINNDSEAFVFARPSSQELIDGDCIGRIAFKKRIMDDHYNLTVSATRWIQFFKQLLV